MAHLIHADLAYFRGVIDAGNAAVGYPDIGAYRHQDAGGGNRMMLLEVG